MELSNPASSSTVNAPQVTANFSLVKDDAAIFLNRCHFPKSFCTHNFFTPFPGKKHGSVSLPRWDGTCHLLGVLCRIATKSGV